MQNQKTEQSPQQKKDLKSPFFCKYKNDSIACHNWHIRGGRYAHEQGRQPLPALLHHRMHRGDKEAVTINRKQTDGQCRTIPYKKQNQGNNINS